MKRERLLDASTAAADGGGPGTAAMSMADLPAEVPVVCNGVRGVLVLSSMRVGQCGCAECGAKGPDGALFHPTHWEQHCGEWGGAGRGGVGWVGLGMQGGGVGLRIFGTR